MANLVIIKRYSTRMEAELGQGLLEANGIKVMIAADDVGSTNVDLGWNKGGTKLLVREEDKEQALRLLEG